MCSGNTIYLNSPCIHTFDTDTSKFDRCGMWHERHPGDGIEIYHHIAGNSLDLLQHHCNCIDRVGKWRHPCCKCIESIHHFGPTTTRHRIARGYYASNETSSYCCPDQFDIHSDSRRSHSRSWLTRDKCACLLRIHQCLYNVSSYVAYVIHKCWQEDIMVRGGIAMCDKKRDEKEEQWEALCVLNMTMGSVTWDRRTTSLLV